MSWAQRRRGLVIFILVAIIAAIASLMLISALYRAPSCTDGVKNQGELGVDCGGPCPYLCMSQVQQPVVRIQPRPLANGKGRTDVIAYVNNTNATAAVRNAPYTIQLYDAYNNVVGEATSTINLPPHTTVPIFIPNFPTKGKPPVTGFLTFATSTLQWFTLTHAPQPLPITNIQVLSTTTPRISAVVSNPNATPLYNIKVIIAVFNAAGNIMAASQTIVPQIPAQGSSPVTFTWQTSFSGAPTKEEVWPIVPFAGP